MFLYLLIKIFLEIIVNNKKFKYFFSFFECFIIIIYFFFLVNNQIEFKWYLFLWCLFWILLFLFLKSLNYILKNFNKIIKWIEKKERIKKILLYPAINKCIYYFVWMLPWNIGYWIYFWVMENGWYFRVWICSNRDIIFYKYFKWDSRDFFFKSNKILFENFFLKFLNYFYKNIVLKLFLRVLILFSKIRGNLINVNFINFLLNRIFVFCYLNFFFLAFFENLQILNRWILIVLIIIETFFFLFIEFVLIYMIQSNKDYYNNLLNLFDPIIIQLMIDPLTYREFLAAKSFFEVNNQVWNIILGDSISLGILKEYMLWVNKNTKGYYFYKMNILPKYNIKKYHKLSSIPFDILPRTRYVIMNLRNINNNFLKDLEILNNKIKMPDYRIREMKNLYLTYFEKTYAVDSSLLSIIFLLRMNFPINYSNLDEFYGKIWDEPIWKVINHIMLIQKSTFWKLRLAEINKANPELFNIFFFLNSLKINKQLYNIEYLFMSDFFKTNMVWKIPEIKEISSVKEYKGNINLLTHFVLYEEEGIVWNNDIIECLELLEIELINNKLKYNKIFFNLYINLSKENCIIDFLNYEISGSIEEYVFQFLKLEFNLSFELCYLLDLSFNQIKNLDLKVVNIKDNEFVINEKCLEIIHVLEILSKSNIKDLGYDFLFDYEDK